MLKSLGSSKVILFLLFVFFTEIATQKFINCFYHLFNVVNPIVTVLVSCFFKVGNIISYLGHMEFISKIFYLLEISSSD